MPHINTQIAAAFEELADLLQISGQNKFRVLSYRRVASELAAQARDISRLSESQLLELKGVGKATARMIADLVEFGSTPKLEEARAAVPPGIREMTALSGLGPKKALLLSSQLGISSLDQLKEAIEAKRLRSVKGLGPKTEANLARALKVFTQEERRIGLEAALLIAEEAIEGLRSAGIRLAEACGSLRRMKETIGDIDLLAAGAPGAEVMDAFKQLPIVSSVAARGATKSSVITREGLQVDLRAVATDEFGAALQYFTGSKEHNVRVREIAVKRGYKLSEYGLFSINGNVRVASETEQDIYEALGMQLVPPPMRENRGEIELSLKRELVDLVQVSDMQGDLHSHSTYSDGTGDVREMALAAAELGYRYYAITDHAYSHHVRSHSVESLLKQREQIDELNEELQPRIKILQGVELDIGPEGDLESLDGVLHKIDVVVASIHGAFTMDRRTMTKRIVRALSHPRVNILGHPTGRRLGVRPAIEVDLEEIFSTAARNGVAVEINATPTRLDLKDDHIRLAREYGCRFAIDTDSHTPSRLARMRLGVGMAQRGWVTKSEVINCLPIDRLEKFLSKS